MQNASTTILRPVRLPAVRDRLVRHWGEQRLSRIALIKAPAGFRCYLPGVDTGQPDTFAVAHQGPLSADQAERLCTHIAAGLTDADMYWVSAQFTRLAAEAATDLPDMRVEREQLPAESGLIVYEEPVMTNTFSYDSDFDHPVDAYMQQGSVPVDAISWFTTDLGVWVNMYVIPEKQNPDVSTAHLRDEIGYLLPHSPGGGMIFGQHNNFRQAPSIAVLLATWFLIGQPGVADDQPGPVDKSVKRKYDRAGRTYRDVHIINLRRRPVPEGHDAPDTTRTYTVRWIVKGHWRDQAYGPGRTLRRRTYIAAYLKGPDDAPIKATGVTVKKLA